MNKRFGIVATLASVAALAVPGQAAAGGLTVDQSATCVKGASVNTPGIEGREFLYVPANTWLALQGLVPAGFPSSVATPEIRLRTPNVGAATVQISQTAPNSSTTNSVSVPAQSINTLLGTLTIDELVITAKRCGLTHAEVMPSASA